MRRFVAMIGLLLLCGCAGRGAKPSPTAAVDAAIPRKAVSLDAAPSPGSRPSASRAPDAAPDPVGAGGGGNRPDVDAGPPPPSATEPFWEALLAKKVRAPVRLAAADEPTALAIDATHVYWTGSKRGSVHRVAKTGGTPELLHTYGDYTRRPRSLAVDDQHLYLAVPENRLEHGRPWAIHRMPKSGGAVTVLHQAPEGPEQLVLDGDQIYFLERRRVLGRMAKAGGPVNALSSRVMPFLLVMDGEHVLVAQRPEKRGPDQLARLSKRDGQVVSMVTFPAADLSVLDGDHLYFTSLRDCTLSRMPKTGGSVQVLARGIAGQQHWEGLAVDATHVYVTLYGWGPVIRVPKVGGRIEVVANLPSSGPKEVVLDQQFVYWIDSDSVRRTPKPPGR